MQLIIQMQASLSDDPSRPSLSVLSGLWPQIENDAYSDRDRGVTPAPAPTNAALPMPEPPPTPLPPPPARSVGLALRLVFTVFTSLAWTYGLMVLVYQVGGGGSTR